MAEQYGPHTPGTKMGCWELWKTQSEFTSLLFTQLPQELELLYTPILWNPLAKEKLKPSV